MRRSALPGMADCRMIAKSAPAVPWGAAHCDLSYPRHAPNHVSDIVCYQQSAVRPDRHPYGSPIGLLLVRREKTRQDVARAAGRAAVLERNEDHLVSAELAAVPGAVLANHHSVGEPGERAGGQPTQTERRRVAPPRLVKGQSLRDRRPGPRPAVRRPPPPIAGKAATEDP